MPLLYFNEINSTNDFIRNNIHDFKDNFSGVYTFNQTQGKGMRGNTWISEPGKNIAMTFCLTSDMLSPIIISFWIPLVVRNFIEAETGLQPQIKWPNDILIHKKKICGILIEKSENTFIIGMGINVYQEKFSDLSKASSLYLFNPKKYPLPSLVENLILSFENNLSLLNAPHLLLTQYNSFLFGKDKVMTFKVNNTQLNGIIQKVDENGMLCVNIENEGLKKFRIKEIEFLY